MRLDIIFRIALILIPGLASLVFMLAPEKIIRWQSHIYRSWYKDYLKWSDEAIDGLPQTAWDRYLVGNRSLFIRDASSHPENYTRLLRMSRGIGCFIAVI